MQCIKDIPNFDAKKFEMITGINTEKEKGKNNGRI